MTSRSESADGGRTAGVAPKRRRGIRWYQDKYGQDWILKALECAHSDAKKKGQDRGGSWRRGAVHIACHCIGMLNSGGDRDQVIDKFLDWFGDDLRREAADLLVDLGEF